MSCSSSQPSPASSPSPVAPQPQAEMTTTALTVSAVKQPVRVSGSDGKTHLEYDLILQSMFDAPVTVTSIEVFAPNGASLLKLEGEQVATFAMPVFSGPPTAVVPPSGSMGTVIDIAVPPTTCPTASITASRTGRAPQSSSHSWAPGKSPAPPSLSTRMSRRPSHPR
jgi:hypothetical protein